MIKLDQLMLLLNNKFLNQYNTTIVGGFDEPFYQASKDGNQAEIQFTRDYIRSALHELSHWCVAGNERRKHDDYGYWYAQDGRTQQQQDEFFKLEVKPQAIEWAYSIFCGVQFQPSVDNLNNQVQGVEQFGQNLRIQMQQNLDKGFSKRVSEIITVLANYVGITDPRAFISQKTSMKNN